MITLEELILYHNSDQRAKIYNLTANKVWNVLDRGNAETCLLCSYVINQMIEEGRLTYHENKRSDES